MKNKTVILLGLLVVIALSAGCLLISLGGAPVATIIASDIVSEVVPPQITLPDSSSQITMTVSELTGLLGEVFRHDEVMQRDALNTVRDVAVSADVAASASSVGRSLATAVIGLGLIAVLVVTVMIRGD